MSGVKEFRKVYSHCSVPTSYYEANQKLAAPWLECQRRRYKLRPEGKEYNLTPERIRDLESIGFDRSPAVLAHHGNE